MNGETNQDDRIAQVSRTLKLLSVDARLRIVVLLRDRDLCVGALTLRLGLSQGAVSQHLKILRDAGLVTALRRGAYVHYRVDEDQLREWQRRIEGLLASLPTAQRDGAKAEGDPPLDARNTGRKSVLEDGWS